jgi:hypothetical protein
VFLESKRSAETATRRLREDSKFAQQLLRGNCKLRGETAVVPRLLVFDPKAGDLPHARHDHVALQTRIACAGAPSRSVTQMQKLSLATFDLSPALFGHGQTRGDLCDAGYVEPPHWRQSAAANGR